MKNIFLKICNVYYIYDWICEKVSYAVGMEKFAGLNFYGFHPTEIFTEILSRFLSQKCLIT